MHHALHRFVLLRQIACITLFAVFLLLPVADNVFRFAPRPELSEMRSYATRPELMWTRDALRKYPASFERYFNDAFGFRNLLTTAYNHIKYIGWGTSPHDTALVGTDGWLYHGGKEEIQAFQRLDPFNAEEAWRMEQYLVSIQQWLATRDIAFVLLIPPNKSTIYPEYMPPDLHRAARPGRLDQVVGFCRQHGIAVVDMRETFERERHRAPMYYRLDTHWTPYAALMACRDVLRVIDPTQADPAGLTKVAWSTNATRPRSGDLAKVMGMDRRLSEPLVKVDWKTPHPARCTQQHGTTTSSTNIYETSRQDFPTAVLFRDSFADAFLNTLASNFRKLIDIRQCPFDTSVVEKWHPDVIIYEFVERLLYVPDVFGEVGQVISQLQNLQPAWESPSKVGANAFDTSALLGAVRRATRETSPGWLLYGRYEELPPGHYDAMFHIKVQSSSTNPVAQLNVSTKGGTQQLETQFVDARNSGLWEERHLYFDVQTAGLNKVEFRVAYMGGGEISIDYIRVTRRDGEVAAPGPSAIDMSKNDFSANGVAGKVTTSE